MVGKVLDNIEKVLALGEREETWDRLPGKRHGLGHGLRRAWQRKQVAERLMVGKAMRNKVS